MNNLHRISISMLAAVCIARVGLAQPSTSTGAWKLVGTGDCSGHAVGTNSMGPNPDAARCNSSLAGITAVCWNNDCNYKDIAPGACKGGAYPGRMYACQPASGQGAVATSAQHSPDQAERLAQLVNQMVADQQALSALQVQLQTLITQLRKKQQTEVQVEMDRMIQHYATLSKAEAVMHDAIESMLNNLVKN